MGCGSLQTSDSGIFPSHHHQHCQGRGAGAASQGEIEISLVKVTTLPHCNTSLMKTNHFSKLKYSADLELEVFRLVSTSDNVYSTVIVMPSPFPPCVVGYIPLAIST